MTYERYFSCDIEEYCSFVFTSSKGEGMNLSWDVRNIRDLMDTARISHAGSVLYVKEEAYDSLFELYKELWSSAEKEAVYYWGITVVKVPPPFWRSLRPYFDCLLRVEQSKGLRLVEELEFERAKKYRREQCS